MHRIPRAQLALVLVLACAPAARADGPLGEGAPCLPVLAGLSDPNDPKSDDIPDVIDAMAFENGFPELGKACPKQCKKARATCAKYVKRAVTCNRKSIDDSTFFQVKVSCPGLKGSALKSCAAEFEDARSAAREALDEDQTTALADCDDKAQACTESCSAP